jgi:hypothetical protein
MNSFLVSTLLCMVLSFSLTLGASAATPVPPTAAGKSAAAMIGFQEFFRLPVGAYGLEPSERLLEMQGRTVRITGYVADEQDPIPGLLLLAPVPVVLSEREDGPADDLPGSTLFVHLPDDGDSLRNHRGPVEFTGRLEVGGREEADGRISYVRLYVSDSPSHSAVQASTALPHSSMEMRQ